ncbi:flagellin [Kordiimonas sp.]|uniref:flagellin N-terminal helical domain-containing protein n=1 Tax=Kordiimonas sp. TaxID=1970157 RepID=UPI003B5179B1
MFSVNTNAGAFAALQNLNTTSRSLEISQSRVNTGLKVSSARDDAALYSIAQNMRGDVAGFRAVNGSLSRAQSELDVAIAGAEAISDLLIEMKEKAVAAKDSGLDAGSRQALSNDFVQLKEQITSIAENATFNGKNLLTGDILSTITDSTGSAGGTITSNGNTLTLSALAIDAGDLVSTGGSVSGTVEALAGQTMSAAGDADFRAAVVNLQNDNGGDFNGETIDPNTGVTTNNVGGTPTTEFQDGFLDALGINGDTSQYGSGRVDGYPYRLAFQSTSTVYLVRNGASSYLTVGNPNNSGDASTNTAATAAVAKVEAAISSVNDVLSNLGSTANRLDIQQQFAGKLSDSLEVGIGNLVDADLAKESADLQAFQTKQQLGLQALSIANQGPQSVLALFR